MSAADVDTDAPLSSRIAQALAEAPSSFPASEIAAVISETKAEIARRARDCEAARKVSLNPLAPHEAVTKGRLDQVNISFRIERLEVALDHLQKALKVAQTREADAAYKARVEQATAERDALAAELRETYTRAAGELADLFSRIKAFEATKPAIVDPVESKARGVAPNGIHWLHSAVHLPAFAVADHQMGRALWPPQVTHTFVMPPEMVEAGKQRGAEMRQIADEVAQRKREGEATGRRRLA